MFFAAAVKRTEIPDQSRGLADVNAKFMRGGQGAQSIINMMLAAVSQLKETFSPPIRA